MLKNQTVTQITCIFLTLQIGLVNLLDMIDSASLTFSKTVNFNHLSLSHTFSLWYMFCEKKQRNFILKHMAGVHVCLPDKWVAIKRHHRERKNVSKTKLHLYSFPFSIPHCFFLSTEDPHIRYWLWIKWESYQLHTHAFVMQESWWQLKLASLSGHQWL